MATKFDIEKEIKELEAQLERKKRQLVDLPVGTVIAYGSAVAVKQTKHSTNPRWVVVQHQEKWGLEYENDSSFNGWHILYLPDGREYLHLGLKRVDQ